MERKIDVIDAFDGVKVVFIHDIIFKKKQYVEWKDVKKYLYDIMKIKKETSNLFQHEDLTQ